MENNKGITINANDKSISVKDAFSVVMGLLRQEQAKNKELERQNALYSSLIVFIQEFNRDSNCVHKSIIEKSTAVLKAIKEQRMIDGLS